MLLLGERSVLPQPKCCGCMLPRRVRGNRPEIPKGPPLRHAQVPEADRFDRGQIRTPLSDYFRDGEGNYIGTCSILTRICH